MLNRRQLLTGLAATALGASVGTKTAKAASSVIRVPLRASNADLAGLAGEISSFAIERYGGRVQYVWFIGSAGTAWCASVGQFDVQPYFEVFPAAILSRAEFERRAAQPVQLPPEMPESLRQFFESVPRHRSPWPPAELQPWPFAGGTIEVLERAEFVVPIEGAAPPTAGRPVNQQSWARPGEVPAEATAVAEVGVGLLFASGSGARFLVASGDMPLALLATERDEEIEAYLATCRRVPLSAYRAAAE